MAPRCCPLPSRSHATKHATTATPTSDLPAVRATISTSETLCQGRVLFFHGESCCHDRPQGSTPGLFPTEFRLPSTSQALASRPPRRFFSYTRCRQYMSQALLDRSPFGNRTCVGRLLSKMRTRISPCREDPERPPEAGMKNNAGKMEKLFLKNQHTAHGVQSPPWRAITTARYARARLVPAGEQKILWVTRMPSASALVLCCVSVTSHFVAGHCWLGNL